MCVLLLCSSQEMANVTSNSSVLNAPPDKFGTLLYAFNYASLFVSLVIIFLELVAVFLLQRCKKVPAFSRILSTSFILGDAAGALVFAIHQIIIFIFGINNDTMLSSRVLSVGAMLTVCWASVAFMSIERVVALKINIKYNLYTSKLRIYLLVSFIWIVNILIVTVAVITGFHFHCNLENDVCDIWESSKAGRFVMMSLLIFYECILLVSYIIIHGIASRHARSMQAPNMITYGRSQNNPESLTNVQYTATKAILKIVLAFMLLHAPIVIHLIIFESNTNLRNDRIRRVFHAISYSCIQINSFVSMHLYVAKIDEFKLKFYLILSRFVKKYETKAEDLRFKVYDIVVSTKVSRSTKSTSSSDQSSTV